MDIFEDGGDLPARTVEQEEEEQAERTAPLPRPILLWNRSIREELYPNGIHPECMIVATSKASCALLNGAFDGKKVLGSCILPEASMRGNCITHSLRNQTCTIFASGDRGQLVIVCCQYNVARERAVEVARAIFKDINPKHTIILGAVSSDQLRAGDQDPSQEPLVFLLSTAAAKASSGPPRGGTHVTELPPYLPSGSMASGLPAACLSHLEARGMSGELVVSVDMVPSLLHLCLRPLAQATLALASRRQQGVEVVTSALGKPMVAIRAASAEILASYGGSLNGVGAVFV